MVRIFLSSVKIRVLLLLLQLKLTNGHLFLTYSGQCFINVYNLRGVMKQSRLSLKKKTCTLSINYQILKMEILYVRFTNNVIP